ncbi:MAG: ArnT family glycosyltransferase [Candidatus Brocadiia bacterium]
MPEAVLQAAAWRRWRPRVAVAVVFVAFAALYFAAIPGFLFLKPDTAIYMGLARSLAEGEGYSFNLAPYAKYPPLYPLVLSVVYRLGGESAWAMQALGAACGLGSLVLVYALVKPRAGRWPALAVVVLTGTCTWFLSHSVVYVLSGVPYAFFSLGALVAAEALRRRGSLALLPWLGVAALGVAALYTHLAGVALVPALAGGVLFAKGRWRPTRRRVLVASVVGGVCVAAAAAWVARGQSLGAMSSYTPEVSTAQGLGVGEMVARLKLRFREFVSAPLSMSHNQVKWVVGLAMLALFVAPGLVRAFRRHSGSPELYLAAYFVVLVVAGGEGGHERYVVPVVPLLFYYGYLSLRVLGERLGWWLAQRRGEEARRLAVRVPRVLTVVVGLAVLGYAVRAGVRGKRGASPFSADDRAEARALQAAWQEAAGWADGLPPGATLYAGSGGSWSFVHYFTRRRTGTCVIDEPTARQVARRIVACEATYLLADERERTENRLEPIFETHPECFDRIERNHECELYRIDLEKLRRLYPASEEEGS